MRRKIIGVTVGTPISPKRVEAEIKPVKTIDGKEPDTNGNVDTGIAKQLEDINKRIDDLHYTAVEVSGFTSKVDGSNIVEMGRTITAAALSWSINKTPAKLTLDGAEIAATDRSANATGFSATHNANKTWTLEATDERGAVSKKTAALTFLNGVYYGAAAVPSAYNSAFILGLTKKKLASSKSGSIDVTAGAGQYIYYCYPARFGTASFVVGGFSGGFELVATIPFTNASGYTENYYVYKSEQAGLGALKVEVS